MLDRIVPVHRTGLLDIYCTILNLIHSFDGGVFILRPSAPGIFGNQDTTDAGVYFFFCEPVKKAKLPTETTGRHYYFVPAFDFVGFISEFNDDLVEIQGVENVVPDGKTLWHLETLDGGAKKVEPVGDLGID